MENEENEEPPALDLPSENYHLGSTCLPLPSDHHHPSATPTSGTMGEQLRMTGEPYLLPADPFFWAGTGPEERKAAGNSAPQFIVIV